MKENIKSL